jgi:hypothetical protein
VESADRYSSQLELRPAGPLFESSTPRGHGHQWRSHEKKSPSSFGLDENILQSDRPSPSTHPITSPNPDLTRSTSRPGLGRALTTPFGEPTGNLAAN